MRSIFRKLYRHQALNEEEYSRLMQYVEDLRHASPESYALFHERFAAILYQDYYIYISRFAFGIDACYDFLCNNSEVVADLKAGCFALDLFPAYLHEYLQSLSLPSFITDTILPTLELMNPENKVAFVLPRPRIKELICKYEEGNPYKEIGLKSHFDRIGSYSFVSRLQSIRYLRGHKASEDKIEPVAGDCLGGIFTNKEKSIYYYIFLTEDDQAKAYNACQVLNKALYGYYLEG